MFLRNRWHRSILILIATVAAESAGAADEPFEWTHVSIPRVAFYESAPRSVVALMRDAVREECARTSQPAADDAKVTAARETTRAWLCNQTPLAYLRAVNVFGNKLSYGFACHHQVMALKLRYFTEDMLVGDNECVYVGCDGDTGKYFVEWQDAEADSEE